MNISNIGLNLIKKWEGLRLEAYVDPVGIPTIGYGTIAYPNGRRVSLGEKITEQEAEAYLLHECLSFSARVTNLVNVPLTQNQFDALVSFTYNVGGGAFADSTLRRKLNRSDYAGAAAEFPRWNKGTQNGRKVELAGLTNRRRDERALFESDQAPAAPIVLDTTPSSQEQVTWLEGYREDEKNVIVGWNGDNVVEIISLDSYNKRLLVDVLNQYPKATNFVIAPKDKEIPDGARVGIKDRNAAPKEDKPIPAMPPVPTELLARGASGNDVKVLQERLADLGYLSGPADSIFGPKTDVAVRRFQADAFGSGEADGLVGPITWKRLWSTSAGSTTTSITPIPGVAGKTYLRLTKTERRDQFGLVVLALDYIKDGDVKGTLDVNSGQAHKQNFRVGNQSIAGSMEPLPEGRWLVEDIVWKAGKDIYGPQSWSRGIGPVTTPVVYDGPGNTGRSAIEIHIDWNQNSGSPGTAGCVGVNTIREYKVLVQWLRESDPKYLFVDWGLGTCPSP